MPSYDFRCKDCSHSFRSSMSISQRERSRALKCPECGGAASRVFLTAPNVCGRGRDCEGCNPSPSQCRACSA